MFKIFNQKYSTDFRVWNTSLAMLLCAIFFASGVYAQQPMSVTATITLAPGIRSRYHAGGRLILGFSSGDRSQPRYLKRASLGFDPTGWDGGSPVTMSSSRQGVAVYGLEHLRLDGSTVYYYQAVYSQNPNYASDGAQGNLTSEVDSCVLTPDMHLNIVIDHVIPPDTIMKSRFIRTVLIKSRYLSEFWHRTRHVRAAILLPSGYFKYPNKTYPICYRVGGLNRTWGVINHMMHLARFSNWWFSKDGPQIIYVFLDSRGPYGDTYQVNSANNGPVGTALTKELIPAVEKAVHYKGGDSLRFVVGQSTGGWSSLALQIFYPNIFNGVWSYSPDPVGFAHWGLINIYKDTSVFYNRFGYLQPGSRTVYGEPTRSMKDWISEENCGSVTGNYLKSGGQFGAYNAVWGPKRKNGLPSLMFDPFTGRINHAVAEKWSKYDLTRYLQKNWHTVGPKLRGKIYIWMGDMDGYYSNVATWFLKKYLETTEDPKSDATIIFSPMKGHAAEWSDKSVLKMVALRAAEIESGGYHRQTKNP